MVTSKVHGPGRVILVGAGPGDPGLLTRAGADWLTRADVVIYDHLSDARLLRLAPERAERILAGKAKGKCVLSQDAINRLLVDRAREGHCVVRLKGGDPFVFGRGAEEAEHLKAAGIPCEIVPGITAGIGVTTYAGIPVTHRGHASAVAFVTGHHDPKAADPITGAPRVDWAAIARFPGTIVIYMGLSRLATLTDTLIAEGLAPETPAAVIASGTLPVQRTIAATLGEIGARVSEAGFNSPAILVIGETVRCRTQLNWFEERPLFGQRIVVTRPAEEGLSSAQSLESLGANVLLVPTIEIRPVEDFSELDDAIRRLIDYDWILFTSPNGVKHFIHRLLDRGYDLRIFGGLRLAAIGPSTVRALGDFYLKADLIPETFRSESFAEALKPLVQGKRVLMARADRGRAVLLEELSPLAHVDQVTVYRNSDVDRLSEDFVQSLDLGTVNWITLTSSAIAERLYALMPEVHRRKIGKSVQLASMSPVTSETARRLGWPVAVEARRYDWAGLVEALAEHVVRQH